MDLPLSFSVRSGDANLLPQLKKGKNTKTPENTQNICY